MQLPSQRLSWIMRANTLVNRVVPATLGMRAVSESTHALLEAIGSDLFGQNAPIAKNTHPH